MDKPKVNLRAWEPIEKRKKRALLEEEYDMDTKKSNEVKHNPRGLNLLNNKEVTNSGSNENIIFEEVRKKDKEENKEYIYMPAYSDARLNEHVHSEDIYQVSKFGGSGNDRDKYYREYRFSKNKYDNKRIKPKKRTSFNLVFSQKLTKTLGAGLAAVLLGVVFGYTALNFLVQPMVNQEAGSQNTTVDTNQNYLENTGGISAGNQIIPEYVIYYLQAGVFSEYEGAKQIQSGHLNNGRAAVITADGSYRVFIAVANDKAKADQLKNSLAAEGMELYVKEYTIPQYHSAVSKESFTTLSNFIVSGDLVVESLAVGSIDSLTTAQNAINYDQIQKLHQQFLLDAQTLKTNLTNEGLNNEELIVQDMTEQIYYAVQALNAYKKNPNSQYLWNIQESLLNYKLKYEELTKL